MIKLSIITPVYNLEKYIEELLILFDKYMTDEVEVILVNDGSTDRSREIISKFLEKTNKNIYLISKENGGVSSARNIGMEMASGKYTGFVDGDDLIESNYFQNILEGIKTKKDVYKLGWMSFGAHHFRFGAEFLPEWNCSCWSRVIKTSKIKKLFDTNLKYAEDYKFLAENIKPSMSCGYIKDIIYKYRTGREDSIMGSLRL